METQTEGVKSFRELDIEENILKALDKMGFTAPTPVQALSIPAMMTGEDIIVQAPTGTGKTCAFGIPILQKLDIHNGAIQAVIVCPTRELVTQIVEVFRELVVFSEGVRILALYGGVSLDNQVKELKKRPQIIVATPGRLLDHMNRKTVKLGEVKIAVLDEADRMLDMGFLPDMNRILQRLPKERQTVLYSATMSNEVKRIASRFQRGEPEVIAIGADRPIDTVKQYYLETEEKLPQLTKLLKEKKYDSVLIFVATKRRADRLARQLSKAGFRAAGIHGDLSQNQRERVMKRYREKQVDILVATDVAARGIDVTGIDAVVNYDIPHDVDSYTHRIGRTGRASNSGEAYTFVRSEDRTMMRQIGYATNADIENITPEGAPPLPTAYTQIVLDTPKPAEKKPEPEKTAEAKPKSGQDTWGRRRYAGSRRRR